VERAAEEKCLADIEQYGLHVLKVSGDNDWPEFTYSVGLYHRFGVPEVIILGLRAKLAHWILNELAARVRSGYRYEAGDRVAGLIEGFEMEFRPVAEAQVEPHFGWALWFYDFQPFPTLQLVFPSTEGIWPWEPRASASLRKNEPLLETAAVPDWARRDDSADTNDWQQMRFIAADGRREVLWVEPESESIYRVLNVPVWQYGLSVGTRVKGRPGDRWIEFDGVLEDSTGATVRLYISAEAPILPASRLYLERILRDCGERGLGIGPATFFDPALVAIHVHERSDWNTLIADYLNALVNEGFVQLWQVGDPNEYPSDEVEEAGEHTELIHPRPAPSAKR
jgi:hypothetical protein